MSVPAMRQHFQEVVKSADFILSSACYAQSQQSENETRAGKGRAGKPEPQHIVSSMRDTRKP